MLLLATDLDGTFLGGSDLHKQLLYEQLSSRADIILVFVTGRGLQSVMPLLVDPQIPNPAYIICDVGATVLNGSTLEPIQPLQADIESKWPGSEIVHHALNGVKNLRPQPVPQNRRCSYFYDDHIDLDHLKSVVDSVNCDLIISAGKFVDVLPAGVNKGATLMQLVTVLGIPGDRILVAGDTMNDLSLYKTGYHGVVVGQAEEILIDAVNKIKSVYIAEEAGAGGILEGLRNIPGFGNYLGPEKIFSSDKVV
jgi:glucosylglycerol-phosphate synthase